METKKIFFVCVKMEDKDKTKSQYTTDSLTGETLYEDPQSKVVYVLDREKNTWKPKSKGPNQVDSSEGTPYEFDGKTYVHTDANGVKHRWDLEKETWVRIEETNAVSSSSSESEEDDSTTDEDRKRRMLRKRKSQPGWDSSKYTKDPSSGATLYKDPNDGMTYEWDTEKKAWFPRINEDFIAQYQMNYGFTNDGVAEPTVPKTSDEELKVKKDGKAVEEGHQTKAPIKPQWFEQDEEKTTKVYVQGLPSGKLDTDWSEEEFAKFMSKCGVLDVDVRTNKPKVKLYKDAEGNFKGDGLCTYMKVESVQLALTIIDGGTLDNSTTPLKVERAKFEMKGHYNPKLKPKKLTKKEQERAKKKQDKMLAWEPDKLRGERSKKEKIIVVENVFVPSDFDKDASLILECSRRLREQCSKFGTARKVVVYDKHPKGICQVFMGSPEEGDMAISMLNGRIFSNSKIPMKAWTWDGKTKYAIGETADEEKERLSNWDKFLDNDENDD